jgi:hypothetical protein
MLKAETTNKPGIEKREMADITNDPPRFLVITKDNPITRLESWDGSINYIYPTYPYRVIAIVKIGESI